MGDPLPAMSKIKNNAKFLRAAGALLVVLNLIAFNVLSAQSDRERDLLASELVSICRRFSTSWGDQMSALLGNAVMAVLESSRGGTLLTLRRLLLDDAFDVIVVQVCHDGSLLSAIAV